MMRVAAVLAASVFMLSGLSACSKPPLPPEPPRPVLTLVVGATADGGVSGYTGEVRSRYETQMAFRIPGKIAARLVDVGARVRAGDALARLDPADTALTQASATAQLDLAEAEVKRYRDLKARNFVSQSALDAKETAYKSALAQAELAKNQSAYTVLRADKDGVIDQIVAEAGQVVAAGQPVMRHSRTDALEVSVAVPESRLPEIRVRQTAEIGSWADATAKYRGVVREISPFADAATRTYAVRVTIPDADERLRLGMTAKVRFAEEKREGPSPSPIFSVPSTSVFQQDGKPAVWVVGADDTLSLRPVTVKRFGEESAELSHGLAAGERIVVAGVHKLNAGQKVKVAEQQAPR